MAMKDWKKVDKNVWFHKTKNLGVSIEKTEIGKPYIVYYGSRNIALAKQFKTKSTALKFARAYMRKH